MNLLLDTHIAIWALTDRPRILPAALDLIADPANSIFVSTATIWEIAIKFPLAKRQGAPPFSGLDAISFFSDAGFTILGITPAHAAAVATLATHHTDIFDRLIIAQALYEPMRLVMADVIVARYSDTIILASG